MKIIYILTLLIVVSLSTSTNAAHWVKINEVEMGLLEINVDSLQYIDIENPSQIFKGWSKLTLHKDLLKDGLKIGDYAKSLQHFDCLNKKIKYVSYISYNEKGIVESIQHKNPEFQDIIPESVGETILNSVCSIWEMKLNQNNFNS